MSKALADRVTAAPAAADDAMAAAMAEVERLYAAEQQLDTRRQEIDALLPDAERAIGQSQLARALGEDALEQGPDAAMALQAERAGIGRAIEEARSRRRAAIRRAFEAQAAAHRAQAATLRAEVAARQPKTDRLLAELQDWEACPYVPAPPDGPMLPQTPIPPHHEIPRVGTASGYVLPGMHTPLAGVQFVYVPTPRTLLLRQQADQYEALARQAEQREIAEWGQAEGETIAALWATIQTGGAMAIGPTRASLEDVVAELQVKARDRLAKTNRYALENRRDVNDQPVPYRPRFAITWKGGEIVRPGRVSIPALDS